MSDNRSTEPDNATVAFPAVEPGSGIDAICDAFEGAWRLGNPPDLSSFLASSGWKPEDKQSPLLLEVVCIDLEQRWRRRFSLDGGRAGTPPTADDYTGFLLGDSGPPPAEWVMAELTARSRAGQGNVQQLLRDRYKDAPHLTKLIDEYDGSTLGAGSRSTLSSGSGLMVRCPYCQEQIGLVPDAELESIVCSSCGSEFSLVHDETSTREAEEVSRIGHFELVERVGMGAFGSVWKARDTQLDRTVAIKVPRKGQFDAKQEKAFLREAQNAAQLNHPGIVPVYEVGRAGDTLYIVSEFVRGLTLADWLTGQQPNSREAAELCVPIADALAHAHERGVIHRDLKPGNVMLDEDLRPRLMDFGLARREVGEVTMTVEGQVLGTPAFMSPEQARGEAHKADARSDIYSLGVLFFQLLTSELPFRGNSRMQLHQVLNEQAPSPRKLNSSISKDLETITLKCLEKDPGKRFSSAGEISDELKRWLAGEPIRSRPVGQLERCWRWCRRKPLAASLMATVVTLLAGVFVVITTAYLQTSEALRKKAISEQMAQEVSGFLIELFGTTDTISSAMDGDQGFFTSDPELANLTARELLDRGADQIEERFEEQPGVKMALLQTIGQTYVGIGFYDTAAQRFSEARELAEQTDDVHAAAQLAHSQGVALLLAGEYRQAEEMLRLGFTRRIDLYGRQSMQATSSMVSLGLVLLLESTQEDKEECRQLLEEAVSTRTLLRGHDHPSVAHALTALAAYQLFDEPESAYVTVSRAGTIFETNQSGDWKQFGALTSEFQRGLFEISRENYEQAVVDLRAAIEGGGKLLGDQHPFMGFCKLHLAKSLDELGRFEESIGVFEQAIVASGRFVKDSHPLLLEGKLSLARLYAQTGDHRKSELAFKQILIDARERYADNSVGYADAVGDRCVSLAELGEHQAAVDCARDALDHAEQTESTNPKVLLRLKRELIASLLRAGRLEEAEENSRGLLEEHPSNIRALQLQARIDYEQRDHESLRKTIATARAASHKTGEHARGWDHLFDLFEAGTLHREGDTDKAISLATGAREYLSKEYGTEDEWTLEADAMLEQIRNPPESSMADSEASESSAQSNPSSPATVEPAR